jgi:chromosome segregation ATPase
MAEQLLDAKLARRLDTDLDETSRRDVCQSYLTSLEEEFEMAKDDLDKQKATRADVVALGIALKQMSLTYDEHLEHFENRTREIIQDTIDSKNDLEETRDELQRKIESNLKHLKKTRRQFEKEFDEALSEFESRFNDKLASVEDEIDQTVDRRIASVRSSLNELEEKHRTLNSHAEENTSSLEQKDERIDELESRLEDMTFKMVISIVMALVGLLLGIAAILLAIFV